MIQEFVDEFIKNKNILEKKYSKEHPEDYKEIVTDVIKIITENKDNLPYPYPSFERIHEINDGDYQGTLLYVIAADDYQPSKYWFVFVDYGSCSGCDTLQSIREYNSNTPPTKEQTKDYMMLALHIVQQLKIMG